jgi:acyl carrier protein
MSDVKDKVKEIMVEQLGLSDVNEIKDDSKFIEDLGADSLDIVELVMALEEEFDLEIQDSDAEGILTLTDAVKFIEDKKA